jgi:UDP-N-acetylglucosamine 4-epimerase
VEADVSKAEMLEALPVDIDIVLHQAALGSVPRSIENPVASHQANVNGFLNLLEFCRARKLRLIYASSSSVYGDHAALPKQEGQAGRLLSPYAATKAINETYAQVWSDCYSLETIGLRYFNVFGPRQDPSGAYAAVIPRWLSSIMDNQPCTLNGDGETSRDFCYVENVVQANLLAAYASPNALGRCYNIACGERTTLRQLHDLLWATANQVGAVKVVREPIMQPFRAGDVRHSLASIALAQELLGFEPAVMFGQGIAALVRYSAHTK